VERYLNSNVGGCAKSIEAQLAAGLNSGKAQAAEADDSGAEQRGGLLIWELFGDGIDKVLRRNNVLSVTSVNGITRERRMVAKIFGTVPTELTGAVGMMQPSDAYTRSERKPVCAGTRLFKGADDLVPRDNGRFLRDQILFNDMQIGAADTAEGNANQDFPTCRLRSGIVLENQRVGFDGSRRVEDAGFHGKGTPWGIWMDVKRKGLREKGFITL
jgi:hypothetical protein